MSGLATKSSTGLLVLPTWGKSILPSFIHLQGGKKKKKTMMSPSSIDLQRKHHSHNTIKRKMLKAGTKAAEFRELRKDDNMAVSTRGFLSASSYIPPRTLSSQLRTTNRHDFFKKRFKEKPIYITLLSTYICLPRNSICIFMSEEELSLRKHHQEHGSQLFTSYIRNNQKQVSV